MALTEQHFSTCMDCSIRYHGGDCICADVDGDVSGSPCQPWSRVGKRKGWADERSLVFLAWCVFVKRKPPTWSSTRTCSASTIERHRRDRLMASASGEAKALNPKP